MSNNDQYQEETTRKKRGRPMDGADQSVIEDNLKRMCLAAPDHEPEPAQQSSFFHKPKYHRKVDFLIDELIKKSRKKCANDWAMATSSSNGASAGMELCIPATIGPSPLTDTRLYHRPQENDVVDVLQENHSTSCWDKYSGDVSHSDWLRNAQVMEDRSCIDMMSEESADSCATNASRHSDDDSSSDCEYDDVFLY